MKLSLEEISEWYCQAYYDDTSDYHESCYDWCYQMYFYDEDSSKQLNLFENLFKKLF